MVLGKGKGLIAAVVVIIALTAVAWWGGVHLDGALDLHITPQFPSGTLVIAESLIAWLSLGLLLFGASKMFGGDGGSGAHLAASGLGRFPYLFASIISSRQLLGEAMLKSITVKPEEIVVRLEAFMSPAVIIGGVAIMGFIVWAVAVSYTHLTLPTTPYV